MIRTTKNRPAASRSPLALGLVVLALLTLSLGASAQRTRGTTGKARTGSRTRSADKKSDTARQARTPQRREKTAKGKKAVAVAETPKADNSEAKTKLDNRKTMENEKHLQRMAVIARVGELAKEIGNETLAAKVAPLSAKEGERHRKRLALYQTWSSQLDKGEAVPALGAAAEAAAEEEPAAKAVGKKKKSKAAAKKPRAGRERGAEGTRSRGDARKSSGRRSR